jgi:sugar phosphate isomerase/epimerase
MKKPALHHIANLWTLREQPWSLDEKLRAFKEAGFDGVCWVLPTF